MTDETIEEFAARIDAEAGEKLPWSDERIAASKDTKLTKELLRRRNKETPDFQELLLEGDNLVFAYGTLRPGGANYHLVKNSKWLGEGITLADNFILRSTGGFPTVKITKSHLAGKVCGDVYAVDALTMCELDRLEGNNTLYKRSKKFITMMDQEYPLAGGKTGRPNLECWMYLIPENDDSFDGNWLGTSRMRQKVDGSSVRLYDWDQITAKAVYQ